MKTKNLLVLSATLMSFATAPLENWSLFAIIVAAHAILWHLHKIEVKLNKLLDSQGLFVSEKELAE